MKRVLLILMVISMLFSVAFVSAANKPVVKYKTKDLKTQMHVTMSWNKIKKAKYYQVYVKDCSAGKVVTHKAKGNNYMLNLMKKKKAYKANIKVRAYCNGSYGSWSSTKTITVSKRR